MESVEASNTTTELAAPVTVEAPITQVSEDDALAAVWDKVERDNGASRDEAGKFTSDATKPLEGGEGEEQKADAEISTPVTTDVPLPSNWNGKDELWAKVPADIREPLRAMQEELHQRQSTMGRELAAYKPLGDVIGKYKDYFGGDRGNYKPHEAVDYMFNLQKQMDDRPLDTLLEIADRYELRPKLAEAFGGQTVQTAPETTTLLREIGELKNTIRQLADPSRVDERITQRFNEDRDVKDFDTLMSRVSTDIPLVNQVSEEDLAFNINKSWRKLGETADRETVLRLAVDMAINADPDLRNKAAALKSTAANDSKRVADAKRANETNIRSTSTGGGAKLTEEQELAAAYDKAQRG